MYNSSTCNSTTNTHTCFVQTHSHSRLSASNTTSTHACIHTLSSWFCWSYHMCTHVYRVSLCSASPTIPRGFYHSLNILEQLVQRMFMDDWFGLLRHHSSTFTHPIKLHMKVNTPFINLRSSHQASYDSCQTSQQSCFAAPDLLVFVTISSLGKILANHIAIFHPHTRFHLFFSH